MVIGKGPYHVVVCKSSTHTFSPVSFFPSFEPNATHIDLPSTSQQTWWYRGSGFVAGPPFVSITLQVNICVIASSAPEVVTN